MNPANPAPAIEVRNLLYSYTTDKVLRFPDLHVNKGGQCLLLGESGSGKTTLLHLIGGLLKPGQGMIRIGDTDITKLSEHKLDHFRGQHIGFVFQKNHLITALTVKKNLLMAPFLAGVSHDEARVQTVLQELGLAEKANADVRQLSHGQAQRVAIARAVLNKPDVILADEPTSALDDKNCDRVIELLLSVAKQNQSTLLIATHDQRLKSKIAQQIIL
ncbi:ABC transporter ATP-binding protein [Chryseosolibacter histidini]|uniref:ABC transporter ATP-binding protein n=1 Tax=Chryseosolibacter histidini TaxID=2782349 RepID=UPI0020B292FA|nr:ABC transporter ATP-binding protein [Chryseosolibacter histidini]